MQIHLLIDLLKHTHPTPPKKKRKKKKKIKSNDSLCYYERELNSRRQLHIFCNSFSLVNCSGPEFFLYSEKVSTLRPNNSTTEETEKHATIHKNID